MKTQSMTAPTVSSTPAPASAATAEHAARSAGNTARVALAFGFACLLSFAAFPDVWASMIGVWSNSDTFAHGFIALPCAAWMLWRRRDDWSALPARVWWPGIVALLASGTVWLAGRLGGVSSLEQFGAVGFIPATMLLLAGHSITRSLAFPLGFLFFAVPVGEFLTPIMMSYTADATVTALRWSGIPVYREGLQFALPTGRWSVVEACSGLRYLIASLALGVLYAYLQFRTLRYRLMFVALAIVVPIVANWIRAYGIVLLGHLSDMRLAAGADHLIYGWIFFGIVMAILFWIGSLWREPAAGTESAHRSNAAAQATGASSPNAERAIGDGATPLPARPVLGPAVLAGAVLAIVVAAAWRPVAAALLDATQPVDAAAALQEAVARFPAADDFGFEPRFMNATAELHARRRVDDTAVGVHAFYYARQHETGEMIHERNRPVPADANLWPIVWRGTHSAPWGKVGVYVLGGYGREQRLVWHWYAVGGVQTASAYRAKAATAWSLALGHGDHSLAVVLATPLHADAARTRDEAMRAAAQRLRTMAQALQPSIRAILDGRIEDAPSLVRATVEPPSTSAAAPATRFDAARPLAQ